MLTPVCPKVEALYTNPFGRAISILHGAQESLIHLQMSHLARDILEALESMQGETAEEVAEPVTESRPVLTPVASRPPSSRARWGRSFWGRKRASGGEGA